METEKFCLRWNDFETNISTAFKELRDDKDFFDVTLACDDDQIQAHKVILSACSPFFRTILKKNYHAHPLLYLKGIKYKELLSVINFMYHGEVSVAQEDLNAFLLIAEDLRIKGLTQDEKNKKEKRTPHNERIRNAEERKPLVQAPVRIHNSVPASAVSNSQYQKDQDDEIEEVLLVKTEPLENMTNPSSLTPANQITALVENNDNTAMYGDQLEEFEDYSGDGAVGYDQGNGGGSTGEQVYMSIISATLLKNFYKFLYDLFLNWFYLNGRASNSKEQVRLSRATLEFQAFLKFLVCNRQLIY